MTERVLVDLSAPIAEALDLPRHVPVRESALTALRRSGGLDYAVLARELSDACDDDPALLGSLGLGIARLERLSRYQPSEPAPTPPRRRRGIVTVVVVLAILAGGAAGWFFVFAPDDTSVADSPSTESTTSLDATTSSAPTTSTSTSTTTTTTSTTTTIAPVTSPDVAGLSEVDARASLESLGLVVTVVEVPSYTAAVGEVLSAEPGPGTGLVVGDAVIITVATRPIECNDAPESIAAAGYTDLDDLSSEARAGIDWAAAIGLVGPAPTFDPAGAVSRGTAVTLLWRYVCEPASPDAPPIFDDVAADAFYAAPVGWATTTGVLGPTSPTTISPDDPISRAAFITILWRALGQPGSEATLPFDDLGDGAFYLPAVRWAFGEGLISGTSPTTFAPDEDINRITTVILFDRTERLLDPLVGG